MLCFIKLRPTNPDELAKPLGCLSFAEFNSKAAELTAPHDTTTISALNVTVSPAITVSTPVIVLPDASVISFSHFAPVTSVIFGYLSAGSTQQVCASAFAPSKQG
ncbi:hypothetical protein RIVM261_008040 [Rivularia sp. IAM M-261]|nr:hypothetical protein RIVM261_008040 [Rivularia sp. IAM M-261]